MPQNDLGVLSKIAISKLNSIKPKGWDTDARELFDSVVTHSHPDVDKDVIEGAWRDGLAYMRENHKDEWDVYVKAAKRPQDAAAIPWDKVTLTKGQADGDSFELYFDVDGLTCVIECTDVQLLDPAFIQRKLVMYTRKDVNCPYLGKKQLEAWRRNVVLPWLKSDVFKHVERETMAQVVESLIREYCGDTVAAETGPEVWQQLKRSVLDKGVVYVPFSGLQEFIGRRAGSDPTKKTIKNSLARLGFNVVKKGKSALRFHSINASEIYEEDANPGEAWGGEIDTHRADGGTDTPSGRTGILDQLRAEERDGFETESGERPATPETPSGPPDVPDDPFAPVS